MSYNVNDYRKVRDEFNVKYLKAEQAAADRRSEVERMVPGIAEIHRKMNKIGTGLMDAVISGGDSGQALADMRTESTKLRMRRAELLIAAGYPADYTDIKYECPLCGDTGFIDLSMCRCMKRRLAEVGCESSGMAGLLKTQDFSNFSLDYYRQTPDIYNHMQAVLRVLTEYADNFEVGKSSNIAMFGGTGLGKTHLSSAVAGVVISRGCDVFYTGASGMMSDFEVQRFGNASAGIADASVSNIDRYFTCDLLIIDDLGTEVGNQFTASCLYNVMNTRLNNKRATIISTNLSPDEFRKRYWDRITSRVLGEYRILTFTGTDIRAQKLGNVKKT